MARTKITGTGLDIDNATDIGAAIVDADLFIMDDGAGGTIRKTTASRIKTYVGGSDPSSADGDSLGTASLEWSDLYLADGGIIYFGNDQDVTVTHDPDDGLFLKSIATGDDNPFLLTLQTGETDIAANDVIGKVAFQAPDEGTGTDAILVAAAIQARSEGDFSSSANATSIDFMTGASEAATTKWSITSAGSFLNAGTNTIDMNAGELILDADGDTSITADTDDTIDIRISGADDFQFTANTFTVSTGSRLFAPDGTDAAPSIALGASRNSGMYTTGDGNIALTASGGLSGSGHELRFLGSGLFLLDDSANGGMTTGITINQSGADNEILALKSSDCAHGITGIAETDTYGLFRKYSATEAGLAVEALSEGTTAFWSRHVGTGENTTDATTSVANTNHIFAMKDGTGKTPYGSTGNMVLWSNDGTARVLFKGDGTVHASDTSWATSLDTEDDMKALRMLDKAQSTSGIINSAWDSMIGTDWEYLQKIGIAGSNHPEKGHPDMFSIQGVQKLTMGATWYLGQNFMAFLETVEKRMPGIRKEFEDHMLEQSGRPAMLTEN